MSNSVDHPDVPTRKIETMSRERVRALQLAKLKDQVAWTYERVPWYREKMGELGVVPGDIQTLEAHPQASLHGQVSAARHLSVRSFRHSAR